MVPTRSPGWVAWVGSEALREIRRKLWRETGDKPGRSHHGASLSIRQAPLSWRT